jgi:hypothetical protein
MEESENRLFKVVRDRKGDASCHPEPCLDGGSSGRRAGVRRAAPGSQSGRHEPRGAPDGHRDVGRQEGPGAALWRANAVSGVINIITKHAADTRGGLVTFQGGQFERTALTARYGGSINPQVEYRLFGKYFNRPSLEDGVGDTPYGGWDSLRSGGRLDTRLQLQLDARPESNDQDAEAFENTNARNLVYVRAYADLLYGVDFAGELRYVGAITGEEIPAYVDGNIHLSRAIRAGLRLNLTVENLLHRRHVEWDEGALVQSRALRASLTWKF